MLRVLVLVLLLTLWEAQNLQKLQFYRAELEREKAKIRANKNRSMNAGTIETRAFTLV